MNDFTKDELEEIQAALIMTKMLDQNHDFAITDKIQSMIDNYCEEECDHEWSRFRTSPTGKAPFHHIYWTCIKCNETTEPEPYASQTEPSKYKSQKE